MCDEELKGFNEPEENKCVHGTPYSKRCIACAVYWANKQRAEGLIKHLYGEQ